MIDHQRKEHEGRQNQPPRRQEGLTKDKPDGQQEKTSDDQSDLSDKVVESIVSPNRLLPGLKPFFVFFRRVRFHSSIYISSKIFENTFSSKVYAP